MLRRRDYYRALAVYGLVLCVFRVFAFGVQALIRFMGSGAKPFLNIHDAEHEPLAPKKFRFPNFELWISLLGKLSSDLTPWALECLRSQLALKSKPRSVQHRHFSSMCCSLGHSHLFIVIYSIGTPTTLG